jgi:hypothetical protein
MTEATNQVVVSEDVPAATAASQETSEKMVPQSVVDKTVGAIKHEARNKGYEEGRKAALAEMQLTMQQQQAPVPAPAQSQQEVPQQASGLSLGNMQQGFSPEDIKRMMHEEVSRHMAAHQQTTAWENAKNAFVSKVLPEIQKDPNFVKDVIEPLDLDNNPHLVTLAGLTDNPADILKELRENPEKISDFTNLSRTHPHLAISKMQSLSNSIKANQQALQQQQPNEPLSQLKPSTVTADNGSMTVGDFRKKSYLKR